MHEYLWTPIGRLLRQPAFVICMLALGISAAGLGVTAEKLKWHFRKLPIPLKASFDRMDPSKLGPYRLVQSIKVSEEIEEELGTEDYIEWVLEDTSVDPKDPFRQIMLFVTYYTGEVDAMVLHTPDVCHIGGGGHLEYQENTVIEVPEAGAENNRLPVRMLEFSTQKQFERNHYTVLYFFSVNGTYCNTRNETRRLQNDLQNRYTYFSKVELTYPGGASADRNRYLEASEKLLRRVLPVLYREHWPAREQLREKTHEK